MGWDYTKSGEVTVQEFTAKQYDAVWTSGADYPVVNGINAAKRKQVPIGGEGSNEFIKLLSEGAAEGLIVTNPPAIGGAGMNVALQVAEGKDVKLDTMITPEVFTSEDDKAIGEMYLPGQPPRFITTLSVPGLTNYTDDQVLACKGPGE